LRALTTTGPGTGPQPEQGRAANLLAGRAGSRAEPELGDLRRTRHRLPLVESRKYSAICPSANWGWSLSRCRRGASGRVPALRCVHRSRPCPPGRRRQPGRSSTTRSSAVMVTLAEHDRLRRARRCVVQTCEERLRELPPGPDSPRTAASRSLAWAGLRTTRRSTLAATAGVVHWAGQPDPARTRSRPGRDPGVRHSLPVIVVLVNDRRGRN
jgi:hypothetical protein